MKYFTLAVLFSCTVAFAADKEKVGPPPPAIDVNQVGYVIGFPKRFVVRDFTNKPTSFELRGDNKAVFKGKLTAVERRTNGPASICSRTISCGMTIRRGSRSTAISGRTLRLSWKLAEGRESLFY